MKDENKSEVSVIHTWKVIRPEHYFDGLENFSIYEQLPDGSVKLNPGVKKIDTVLFYNVTDASEEFLSEHADIVEEVPVKFIEKKPEMSAVRIWDIISVKDYFSGLDKFPIYEWLPGNRVKPNPGVRKIDTILFYNVTSASEEFKNEHADIIHEIEVRLIESPKATINTKPQNKKTNSGKIISVIPISGKVYSGLSKVESKMIGKNFYSLNSNPEGIKMTPVISLRTQRIPDNIYALVNTELLSPELLEKISPELEELHEKGNGLYESKGGINVEKEL